MRIALFLGAGASVPYNKPTTAELKQRLLTKDYDLSFHSYIMRSLLQVEKFTDIEYVMQAITDIVNFSKSSGNDYFASLGYNSTFRHTMITHNNSSYTFEQVVGELKKVYVTLRTAIFQNYAWNGNENYDLLDIYDNIFSLLKNNNSPLIVFTTNYDQAIETYCSEKNDLRLTDGFQHDENRQKFIWAKGDYLYNENLKNSKISNVYLYKLHGSLNWKQHRDGWIERTSEESVSEDPKYPNNLLIYPTLSPKEGAESEPYKSIFIKFQEIMKTIDVCIVIGYSFRDHLNKVFTDFINNGKIFIAISPTVGKDFARSKILEYEMNEKELNVYETLSHPKAITFNPMDAQKIRIHLIPKPLKQDNVKDIINEIENAINFKT